MKCLVYSGKGGTLKSCLSYAIQQSIKDCQVITNDVGTPFNLVLKEKEDYYIIPDDLDIPTFNDNKDVNIVYDMGGFKYGKLKSFITNTNDLKIIIPFMGDVVSFQSALRIYNEVKEYSNNIIFCITRAKKGDYETFKEQLEKMKVNNKLFELKESKLFLNMWNKRETLNDIRNNKLLQNSYKEVLKQINDLVKEITK